MNIANLNLRALLGFPKIYSAFQRLVGADSCRRRLMKELIRPFKGAMILDVGCGPAEMLAYFPKDIEYFGLDSNRLYIDAAMRRYGKRATFYCAEAKDSASLKIQDNYFDFVTTFGVLHHLEDQEAISLIKDSVRYLRNGGYFLSFDPMLTPQQKRFERWLMAVDRGKFIRDQGGYVRLISPYFDNREATAMTNMLRIPYTHLFMKCQKA